MSDDAVEMPEPSAYVARVKDDGPDMIAIIFCQVRGKYYVEDVLDYKDLKEYLLFKWSLDIHDEGEYLKIINEVDNFFSFNELADELSSPTLSEDGILVDVVYKTHITEDKEK